MNENTKNQWQKLDELRRTDPHICGGYYTKISSKHTDRLSMPRDMISFRNL